MNRRKFLKTTAGAVAALAAAPALALLAKKPLYASGGLVANNGTRAAMSPNCHDLRIADIERTLTEFWSKYRAEPTYMVVCNAKTFEEMIAELDRGKHVRRKRGFNGFRLPDSGLRIFKSPYVPDGKFRPLPGTDRFDFRGMVRLT